MPSCMITRLTLDRYRILNKHCRCIKKGAMMFAAIITMTHPDEAR